MVVPEAREHRQLSTLPYGVGECEQCQSSSVPQLKSVNSGSHNTTYRTSRNWWVRLVTAFASLQYNKAAMCIDKAFLSAFLKPFPVVTETFLHRFSEVGEYALPPILSKCQIHATHTGVTSRWLFGHDGQECWSSRARWDYNNWKIILVRPQYPGNNIDSRLNTNPVFLWKKHINLAWSFYLRTGFQIHLETKEVLLRDIRRGEPTSLFTLLALLTIAW